MDVAVLGTGIMGSGMTRSLLRDGHRVRAWNRSYAKAERLAADGATVTRSASTAVRGADAVLIVVFDTDAVLDVLESVADDVGAAVILQAATIGLDGTRQVAEAATRQGLTVVDAPVLGTKQPAESGSLIPLVSGDPAAIDRVEPVLDAIGAKTIRAGDELGDASALKLVVNAWVASLASALGQSIAFADRLGIDPARFLEALSGGATDMPYAHAKGASMIGHTYPTSFSVDGVVKDVGLMRDAAQEAGLDDDLLATVERLFKDTSAGGHGDEDMAAVREVF